MTRPSIDDVTDLVDVLPVKQGPQDASRASHCAAADVEPHGFRSFLSRLLIKHALVSELEMYCTAALSFPLTPSTDFHADKRWSNSELSGSS